MNIALLRGFSKWNEKVYYDTQMNKDLTTGDERKVLTAFALPLLGSMIFQQLYNIADSLIAGKFLGEQALAAVGNSYEITLIFIAFAFGCNIGASVLISQYFGGRNYSSMKTAVHTSYIAAGVICISLVLIGFFGTDGLLKLINTPEEIFADSALYLDIYVLGLFFLFFYNIATGIFAAMGDSRTPFIFLAISSTANVFVDILFVSAFKMGVAGVAWATFICQGISCILANGVLFARIHRIPAKGKAFDRHILKKFLIVAIPSILQQSFISIGNIILQSLINGFGYSVIAGYSAAIKLNNLIITSVTTLANAVSSFAAQNIGAQNYDRVKRGWKVGIHIAWCFVIPVAILFCFLPNIVLLVFMDSSATEAMACGRMFLRIVSPFYAVIVMKLVSDAVLRGSGDMRPFMIATFTDLILRVLLAFVFAHFLGSTGIWLSWPVGWTIGTVLSIYFYKSNHWMQVEL